jgi:GH35 family endo-1,4-beta-xylanase
MAMLALLLILVPQAAALSPATVILSAESQGMGPVAVAASIRKGDTLFVEFTLRSAGSDDAELTVSFEPGASRYWRPLNMPATAGGSARRFQFPFRAPRDYAAGEARLVFTPAAGSGVPQVTALKLTNYGTSTTPWKLPITPASYAGSETDAPWRRAARQRIAKIRQADFAVRVLGKDGKPASGADVRVEMKRHAFGFGTAVNGTTLMGSRHDITPEELRHYKEHIQTLFNKAVMENDLKWPQWSHKADRPRALAAVRWLREQGLTVRGHCLVWPSWRWTPVDEALAAKDDPPRLAQVIRGHIREEAGALRGLLAEWDVINEPYSNHDLIDILGREAMVEWFRSARQAAPDARLYINDYDILSKNDTKHQDHYFETIRYLLEQGAPVDGIGMQGHFPSRLTPPAEVLARLDRFAVFKRDIQITEFDIDTVDEQAQAAYTRDFMTAIFSHPSVAGFLMWGFWEKSHWKPYGAMFREDWSIKPNGEAYKKLVFDEWWTRAGGATDASGVYQTRGFLGGYEVTASSGGGSKTVSALLEPGGSRVEIRLD